MITDDEMIAGWYGNIRPANEEQRKFMLETGHLFEMHSVEKLITKENVLKEIRLKYPPERLFSENFLSNSKMLQKFRTHLTGMGIEPHLNSNLAQNASVPIKIAHLIFPRNDFESHRIRAVGITDRYLEDGTTDKNDPQWSNSQQAEKDPEENTDATVHSVQQNENPQLTSLEETIKRLSMQIEN